MMSALEWRIARLEQQQLLMAQQIASLQSALAQAEQQIVNAGGGGGGSGGSSGSFYVAMPGSTVSAATWTSARPAAGVVFSAPVWQVSYNGSSQTITSIGTQNCVNWLASPLVADQGIVVIFDGVGSYGVVSQSCN